MTGVADLASRVQGELLLPASPGYDEARSVWNAAVDRRPAAILRCAGTEDVRSALEIAAEQSLEIAVRAGGHSVSGKSVCDGGLVIDLSRLKGVRVEPNGATANVQPGVTLGELVAQIEPRGFLTTTGIVSTTGLSGLTLGGGIGWLMGRYGLACDNLLSAEVVTADRRLLRASTTENADLLWALRGGGGNFGVVTSFTFRLHRSEPILSGMVLHSIDAAVDVLRFYREYTAAAPDGLTANAALLTSPDGYPIAGVAVCWCGPEDEGERVLAPLRRFGPPVVDTISWTPYAAAIRMMDEAAAPGLARQYRSGALSGLSDDAIEIMVEYGRKLTSPLWGYVLLEHMHGAAVRVAADSTAFAQRDVRYFVLLGPQWSPGDDPTPHAAWADQFWAALQPHTTSGVYVNYLGDEDDQRVRTAYGPNYTRLAQLKRRFDPANVFRLNQNVRPADTNGT